MQAPNEVFDKLGLAKYFPAKLSLRDAIVIRDDTLKFSSDFSIELYPFVMLQKIMAFDSQCRFRFDAESSKQQCDTRDDSDSDSDDEIDSVHPMDCLLALIYCSDNFLRQDLFCRLATCQIAVPLLLPHLETKDPTLLMWAMRSIMKEFKLQDGTTYSGRIITHPTNVVSFIRLGHHRMSKSEILNAVMNKVNSDNKNTPFFCFTSPGGSVSKFLLNGVVEISWYLPGNGLCPEPIAFTNLRGDGTESSYQKQIDFLCEYASTHVVMVSEDMLKESGKRQDRAIELLKRFSNAPDGVIILQSTEWKDFRKEIKKYFSEEQYKSKVSVVKYDSNQTTLVEKIQKKLSKLGMLTKATLVEIARKHKIGIDEEESECVEGKELMQRLYAVIENFLKIHQDQSPKSLLPLQKMELWHDWAAKDKEQYRQRKKNENDRERKKRNLKELSVKEYSEEQRRLMKERRKSQYDETKKMSELMKLFLDVLRTEHRKVLRYCLTWLKFALDDLSRKILPPYYKKIRDKRVELNRIQQQRNESAETACQQELKELDCQLINASFGLEHLLREVSQIYEAVAQFENVKGQICIVKDLPKIAAQLLHDGFPLELLDGDASHMPKQWISAVFENLTDILKTKDGDPKVYVLSVLGIQSTGKSTLLNTVFGVQFSVSAGRCTRGAFMQLIPIHPSLHKRTGVEYILLIDTEGLRAPELDRLESREHDNELATFVIGIANLTLINVAGEVSGEIDDVLNAAVHAFLRMSEVKLKPSGHIVHQHVAAIGAEEKLMQARLKTKDKLDRMTKAAAKDSGLDTKYTYFNDVIQFNHKTDVSEFVDLWSGELPMARVSTGYSERAQKLKLRVIESSVSSAHSHNSSLPVLAEHLDQLWNAIIQEDFVFTFQNTFEIVAFKTLEVRYSDLACSFTKHMGELQKAAENELFGCLPENLDTKFNEHKDKIQEGAKTKYLECREKILRMMKDDEIMLKWKHDMEDKLDRLHEQLRENAQKGCHQAYHAKEDRRGLENDKEKYGKIMLEAVQKLVRQIGDAELDRQELIKRFNETWDKMKNNMQLKPIEMPNIPYVVEECVSKFFTQAHSILFHEKLIGYKRQGKEIREFGVQFKRIEIHDYHIKLYKTKGWKDVAKGLASIATPYFEQKKENDFEKVRKHANATFLAMEGYLHKLSFSDRSFCTQFVTDLLSIIQDKRKDYKEPQLTDEYEVDMALIACGHAIPIFEVMAKNFREKHDPNLYVEQEMRPQFQMMFINMFDKAGDEKTAAEALCRLLETSIHDYVIESLPGRIKEGVKNTYSCFNDKQRFVGTILLEIGERLHRNSTDGFDLCMNFVTSPSQSLEWWAKYFTEQYCHDGYPSKVSCIALEKLDEIINFLLKETTRVSDSYFSEPTVDCDKWLNKFHSAVNAEVKLSLSDLKIYIRVKEFSHLEHFTKHIKVKLEQFRVEFKKTFGNTRYSDTEKRESAHKMIFKDIAGCTEQCPFCGAQCELTISGHAVQHRTQHRPQALGRYSWDRDNTMVLDICTHSVASGTSFWNHDTGGVYYPYRKYSDKYPQWYIASDSSFEASLFWKWFIANYSTRIEGRFGYAATSIDREWQEEWWRVKNCLKYEYKIN